MNLFKKFDIKRIKWYEKILLFFCKSHLSVDRSDEGTCWVEYKKMFGKTYIVDTNF